VESDNIMKKRTSAAKAAKRRGDWRGAVLARLRKLINEADPDIVEEVKWRKPSNPAGVPVWSHDGIVCTGETYKDKVKATFAHGAKLKNPGRLFNASLDGGTRRAIDFFEGDKINERAFKALVRAAVEFNIGKATGKKKRRG
jgi:hypothetical protein